MTMKKEYVDNTVLLPMLQYILQLYHTYTPEEAFLKLETYKKYVRSNTIFEKWYEGTSIKGPTALDELFACIEAFENDPDEGDKRFRALSVAKPRCELCQDCKDCVRAFASEIYEILKGETLQDLIPSNDFEYEKLPDSVEKHLRANETKIGKYYDELHLQHTRSRRFKNSLVILKGTSSSTPSVLNAAFDTQEYHGGGFFISWDGFGIAVDPGYHFLTNLHDAGLDVNDIDAVIITHEHIDHNIDMRLLDDLLFNQRRFGDGAKKIAWYVDAVTYKMMDVLRSYSSGFDEKSCDLFQMTPESGNEEYDTGIYLKCGDNSNVRMKIFKTIHCYKRTSNDKKEFFNHSFGFELSLKENANSDRAIERRLFYSSDTKYSPDLASYIKNSDIAIVNISSVYKTDIMRIKAKDTHLGYMGCYELLKAVKDQPPKIYLISEFWNGITDIRFDICRYLKEQAEKNEGIKDCKILPGEIGMVIDIRSLKIRCDSCGHFVDKFMTVRQHTNNGKISVFCSRCSY